MMNKGQTLQTQVQIQYPHNDVKNDYAVELGKDRSWVREKT